MRLRRLLPALVCLAPALAACAGPSSRIRARAVPAPAYSELDLRLYGSSTYGGRPDAAPAYAAPAYSAPAPASYVRRRVARMVPVAASFEDGPYTLDSGDRLRIVVFGQDTLSNSYAVDAQGQVALPLIGATSARGLTTVQLGQAIAARLRQSFIRDPSVAVEVETYRPFFVLGEVAYPGQYPYVPNMTVENAVAIAGGFTPRAVKDHVTVTRTTGGAPASLKLPPRAAVRPGDTLRIGERWF